MDNISTMATPVISPDNFGHFGTLGEILKLQ